MENQDYFPGQKLNLKIDDQVCKWEVLSVDNTRKCIVCQKLNCLDTVIETFTMERIPHLKVKKDVGFFGAFLVGCIFWTGFLLLALEVYK
ncbi:hypothetical protein [Clostridium sp. YIM B02500]|uniref:hypothetical protein n=1 Tax=Clostridium sp. YIM B02500 TaxID=2910681 RepID=UPI001EED1E53|nr:hypothetical protein [Clostridium sp. YIM B02500]